MAESSPIYYRTQLVLTALGAVVLLGLCIELLGEHSTRAATVFAAVFLVLLLLAAWAVLRRLRKLRAQRQEQARSVAAAAEASPQKRR